MNDIYTYILFGENALNKAKKLINFLTSYILEHKLNIRILSDFTFKSTKSGLCNNYRRCILYSNFEEKRILLHKPNILHPSV